MAKGSIDEEFVFSYVYGSLASAEGGIHVSGSTVYTIIEPNANTFVHMMYRHICQAVNVSVWTRLQMISHLHADDLAQKLVVGSGLVSPASMARHMER